MLFFFIITGLLAVGGILLAAGLRARRRAALISAMPTSNIGMAADGYRELEGHIEAIEGHPTTAPLTHAPCAWYRARVEQWKPSRRRNEMGRWTVVQDDTSGVDPFFIRDATGTVYPYGAEMTPRR